jgi:hypothetical protein
VHHVDLIYPRGLMTPARLKADGLDPEAAIAMGDRRDLLPNLQFLEGPENTSKKNQQPLHWARATSAGSVFR